MAANFEIPTTEIKVRNGSFTVRGLNSEDLTFLYKYYLEDIKATVARYGERTKNGALPKSAVADLVLDLVSQFPMMAVEIISRAAEATSSDDIAKFRRLSFIKQVEAMKEIAILTVEDGEVELKKVGAFLANLLEANGLKLGTLSASLQNIIETYEKPLST